MDEEMEEGMEENIVNSLFNMCVSYVVHNFYLLAEVVDVSQDSDINTNAQDVEHVNKQADMDVNSGDPFITKLETYKPEILSQIGAFHKKSKKCRDYLSHKVFGAVGEKEVRQFKLRAHIHFPSKIADALFEYATKHSCLLGDAREELNDLVIWTPYPKRNGHCEIPPEVWAFQNRLQMPLTRISLTKLVHFELLGEALLCHRLTFLHLVICECSLQQKILNIVRKLSTSLKVIELNVIKIEPETCAICQNCCEDSIETNDQSNEFDIKSCSINYLSDKCSLMFESKLRKFMDLLQLSKNLSKLELINVEFRVSHGDFWLLRHFPKLVVLNLNGITWRTGWRNMLSHIAQARPIRYLCIIYKLMYLLKIRKLTKIFFIQISLIRINSV